MPSIYDSFLDGTQATPDTSLYDSFLGTQEATPEPIAAPTEDLANEQVSPEVTADIEAAIPKEETKGILSSTKSTFQDLWNSYRKRVSGVSESINKGLETPFKPSDAPGEGPEWLQRVGDVGGKIGSGAIGLLETGTTIPVAAATQTAITDPIFNKVGENATPEQKEKLSKASENTADLLSMAILAPKPLEKVGTVGKKSIADMLSKEETKAQLQDMGYDVSNLGTEGAQQFTKRNATVAEAMGSVPKGTAEMLPKAELQALDEPQQAALGQLALAARNPTQLTPEQIATTPETLISSKGKKQLYHSTTNPNLIFEEGKGELGTHLASTTEQANEVAKFNGKTVDPATGRVTRVNNIHPVQADIKNPLRLRDYSGNWLQPDETVFGLRDRVTHYRSPEGYPDGHVTWNLSEEAQKAGLTDADLPKIEDLYHAAYLKDDGKTFTKDFQNFVKSKGFDSIVYKNQFEDIGSDSYIVFDPKKISSSIANKPILTLTTEQYATNIAEPVANAVDSGVPIEHIKDQLVQNLLAANRKPQEVDDIVEAALAPYRELKVSYEALNEFKPTSIPSPSGNYRGPAFFKPKEAPKANNLLTKEDVESIVNSKSAKQVAQFVDDFTFQNRFSRKFSKKNSNLYGDLELNAKDTTLNKIASVREVNNNVFTSWIDGDTKGRVYGMTNGIQQLNPNVKPLRKIYSDAAEAGLDAEQAKLLHQAANANSNWQRIDANTAKVNTKLSDLKQQLSKATTDQERAILRNDIKKTTTELNEAVASTTYMPKAEVDTIMNGIGKTDAGQEFLDDMKVWTDGVLDMRVRSGRLAKDEANAMKSANKNYLPELRDVEDYADLGIKISGTKDASKGIQARGMSDKTLNVDPVEALVDYLGKTEHAALRTEERYHTLIHNLEHMDDGAFNVLFEQDKNKVIDALLKIKAGKSDKVIDGRELILNPDKTKIQSTPNFSVFVDGKRLDLTVKNTEYLRALTRPRLYQKQSMGERYIVNPLAHVTRNSFTTWNPIFQPAATLRGMWGYKANMPKDLAGVRSEGTKVPFRKVASDLLKDKDYYDYLKANISPGVLNRGLHGKNTQELITSTIQRINKPEAKGLVAKPKQGVVYVKNNLEEWAEFNEMVVRGRAYEETKATLVKQGMAAGDAERAAFRVAKNLETNYFSQGNSGALYRFVQNGTPFLRTRINGALKTINSVKYRPKEVAGGIAAYMAILHGTNVYNRQYTDKDGSPLVDKLDPYIRENNFVIMLPGATSVNDRVQLASPFNIIRLGNAAEMAFDKTMKSMAHYVYDNVEPAVQKSMESNPVLKQYMDEGKLSAQDVASIALDLTLKDFDPTAFTGLAGLGTLAEVAVNKDSFGNEIVPSYMKDLPEYQQINPTRSNPVVIATAQALAERGITGVNPTLVSYVVQDTLGGIGDMMLAAGDTAYSVLTGKEKPQPELKNIPGIGRFTGLGSELPNTGIEKQYSATYKELSPVYKEYQKLKTQADTDSAYSDQFYKFYENNIEAIMLYKEAYEPVQKELTKAYKELNRLQGISGETLPSESTPTKEFFGDPVRREQIDAVRKDIQFLQQSALDELYERRDVLGETWSKRLKVGTLPAAIRPVFLDNIEKPKEKSIDKPKEKGYNKSEIYDDSNPLTMAEQSGMDLQTVDYQPTVYELFLEKGADTFNPKDVTLTTGPEEPVNKHSFFQRNFPNMTAQFGDKIKDFIINRTLKLEGGSKYTEHVENGKQTPTKYGVTLDTLKITNPKATKDDVKALTEQKAADIYNKIYWQDAKVDQLPKQLKDIVFDGNINHGVPGMTKVIQRALNDLGVKTDIDGRLGPKTIQALNDLPPEKVREAIIKRRQRLYEQHPDADKFGKGWSKRLEAMVQTPKEVMEA